MEDELYNRYKEYSKNQIFDILKNQNDYQDDAIRTAKRILREKNWTEEYESKQIKEQHEYEEEIAEKAEYYKKAADFQKDNYYFNIRTSDMPKLEAALLNNGIDFYREPKHVGVQLDSYPTEKYYFKREDAETVDQICIELELVTAPYTDYKPFFKMELKVLIVVVVVIVLLLLFVF
ncbi:MAG: hypothetical protein V2A54_03315 [Bacteroidota bacterium]